LARPFGERLESYNLDNNLKKYFELTGDINFAKEC
jgi:hypothetical protein